MTGNTGNNVTWSPRGAGHGAARDNAHGIVYRVPETNDRGSPMAAADKVRSNRDRYDAGGLPENQFEPGSRGRVLKNPLGIRSKREMDRRETRELLRAAKELSGEYDALHRFTASDIREIHRRWLGRVYPWAGRFRSFNLAKGTVQFAAARYVPALMDEFEHCCLAANTPCLAGTTEEIVRRLAVVHVELVLIHPFRDGNGRTARLLATLMGLQAGLPPLEFGGLEGANREAYLAAVRAGFARDYRPMGNVFRSIVESTIRGGA